LKDEDITTRTKILALMQDLLGEKAEKYHNLEGRLCMDCPMMTELFKDVREAYLQDKEKLVDAERERYGLLDD